MLYGILSSKVMVRNKFLVKMIDINVFYTLGMRDVNKYFGTHILSLSGMSIN